MPIDHNYVAYAIRKSTIASKDSAEVRANKIAGISVCFLLRLWNCVKDIGLRDHFDITETRSLRSVWNPQVPTRMETIYLNLNLYFENPI